MRPRLIVIVLITGVLLPWAVAQENTSAQNTNPAITRAQQLGPGSKAMHPTEPQVPHQSPNVEGYPQGSGDSRQGTIAVDVWSSATSAAAQPEEDGPAKLSPDFARAALTAALKMQLTEHRVENTIKKGYPLIDFWIQTDLDGIDDSLRVATLSVTNDSDRQALQQLENQSSRLHLWSDRLIDANRNLRLGDYFMSASVLDNDERFQSSVACTKFLVSMLASRRLADDNSCL